MIIIVSHDAGGAEVLSSWVRRNFYKYKNIYYLLKGPALKIFSKKLDIDTILTMEEFQELSYSADFILTGTSWQSDLERFVIKNCIEKKIKIISFLDHWVNYKERFLFQNNLVLPNILWVGDLMAYEIAKNLFSSTQIEVVQNPYFCDIKDEYLEFNKLYPRKSEDFKTILYCSEPIADHSLTSFGNEKHLGYDEYDALENFLNWLLKRHEINNKVRLTIRLHPADIAGKYDDIIVKFPQIKIEYSQTESLAQDIFNSDVIIGCESMALAVGVVLDKMVISCIPHAAKKCKLPYDEITPLHKVKVLF